MTNEEKKRLVLFGTHAGYSGRIFNVFFLFLLVMFIFLSAFFVGMIDGLHGLGLRLLGLGYSTPFMVCTKNPSLLSFIYR
jgi:alpha-aminoadipic semialdehyde synthase